jgi:hypothetical protein
MKNVHLVPTNKPSSLFEILQWNYIFDKHNEYSEEYKELHGYKNRNLYITNDEEIKIGDWVIEFQKGDRIGEVHFINGDYVIARDIQKKIILTTDSSLSPDVHKIDDEFLEWFASNPTCDEVEIDKRYRGVNLFNYKIIIPQDKQHFWEEETLEEFARREANDNEKHGHVKLSYQDGVFYGIQIGAQWQKELGREVGHSVQVDVLDLIQFLSMDQEFNGYGSVSKDTAKYFLEQYKKGKHVDLFKN